MVKLLLNTGMLHVDSKDSKDSRINQTPLSWAVEHSLEAVVKLRLNTGNVVVDSKDLQYQSTPLSWTAQKGHETVGKVFLDTGNVRYQLEKLLII